MTRDRGAGPFTPVKVFADGREELLGEFGRYDSALQFADMLAHSIGRQDAYNAWLTTLCSKRARPLSGVQAIILEHDVWVVPEIAWGLKGIHPVSDQIPRGREHDREARRVAFARKGYEG